MCHFIVINAIKVNISLDPVMKLTIRMELAEIP